MQVARILSKLDRARAEGVSCFGSQAHRFRLNPPLPEAALAAFEREHQVSLPGEYRQFLLQAGDGGAGPYYGLRPLESWRQFDWDELAGRSDLLSHPCPIVPGMPRARDWYRQLGRDWYYDCYTGMLPVASQGCTYWSMLVLSGAGRGRIVNIDEEGQPPFFSEDADFLSWYERWLDHALQGRTWLY